MPTVILYGPTASFNQGRLERLLSTDWQTVSVPDNRDLRTLLRVLPNADAYVGLRWIRDWTKAAERLRLIHALGAGVDTFDQNALPDGCSLCNVFEHAVPVAEYVIGAMVAMTVRFASYDRSLRSGRWDGSGRLDGETHSELAGQTIGLIGWGSIGREVARRARVFGMKIHAVRANPAAFGDAPDDLTPDWHGGPARLEEMLGAIDFLVVCCPLSDETRGLLDRRKLGLLKPTAYLINVARAEIIEEDALFAALHSRAIAGAALDVWYRYPATLNEQLLPAAYAFHELENVLMTPHLSAWTEAMIERRWRVIAANLDALAEGRPLKNVVRTFGI